MTTWEKQKLLVPKTENGALQNLYLLIVLNVLARLNSHNRKCNNIGRHNMYSREPGIEFPSPSESNFAKKEYLGRHAASTD